MEIYHASEFDREEAIHSQFKKVEDELQSLKKQLYKLTTWIIQIEERFKHQ